MKSWEKKYIFCCWVALLVYVTSSRRSQAGRNLDGAPQWMREGDACTEEDMCHSGEGWSPSARKPAPGRKAIEKSCECPRHDALLTQWWIPKATHEPLEVCREQLLERKWVRREGRAPTRAQHKALELFKAWKIARTAHETAAVWDWSFISHSKESTEYPTYVENYTGHLPYLVQRCTDITRGQDTFILHL